MVWLFGVQCYTGLLKNTVTKTDIQTSSVTLRYLQQTFLDLPSTLFSKMIAPNLTGKTQWNNGHFAKICVVLNGHHKVNISIPSKIMKRFWGGVINVRRHNLKDLEQALVNEWIQILVKWYQQLFQSMPNRIWVVIRTRDRYPKYWHFKRWTMKWKTEYTCTIPFLKIYRKRHTNL